MSVVELKKVTLCGPMSEKSTLLTELQALGCLHLRSLRPPPREPETEAPETADEVRQALAWLMATPVKRHQITAAMLEGSDSETFDLPSVVSRTLALRQRARDLSDQRDALRQHIRQLEPWGDFQLPDEAELAGYRLWFYLLPLHQLRQLPRDELVWQMVHQDQRQAYLVVVARDEPPADALPVPRVHTGPLSLTELRRHLHHTEIDFDEVVAERQALTRWILLLTQNLAYSEDQASLRHAGGLTLDAGEVFAVQGWLPVAQVETLERFAEDHHLAWLIEAALPQESPPTLLQNPDLLAGGEELVRFYQTPAYGSWDPSVILFGSFVLFFAMILSDAGYGLVLGVLLLLGWKRLGRNTLRRRLRILGTVLVGATLIWGLLAGSYFGAAPPTDSWLAGLQLIDLKNFDSMMRLSILIGAGHIILANAALAWHNRGQPQALARLGWILAVTGGLALGFGRLGNGPAWWADAGPWLLGAGLLAVVAGNGSGGRSRLHWLKGLTALSGISRLFGDVLSYLRLFALGLASASLALTLNQLADQVSQSVPGIGFLLSLMILLLGHSLNLALAVMSGVVHGLRLNFIEFYNWGQTGEGYPFKAFRRSIVDADREKGDTGK
ncbi:MAG: V-type ATP synthase subunit I [Oceanospirillaceae bacterium]|nr:V-type ATP synthase subunit I [Oceanospirillaceae bacterium]